MRSTLFGVALLVGCGGDDGGGGGAADASNVPATITISGAGTKREGTNTSAAAGVLVAAYRNNDPNTAVATAMTNAQGSYSLTIPTNGQPVDGYLKATLSGFLDTYLYPPRPLVADFDNAALNILNSNTLGLLSGTLCGSSQMTSMGAVAVIVADAADAAVAGATVASSPAAAKICYNSGGFPNRNATMTDTDGVAYMLNVTAGTVTVSAGGAGAPYSSHPVNARAGAFTTTVIQP